LERFDVNLRMCLEVGGGVVEKMECRELKEISHITIARHKDGITTQFITATDKIIKVENNPASYNIYTKDGWEFILFKRKGKSEKNGNP